MTTETNTAGWAAAAILVGRLIFAGLFIMAASFKFMGMKAAFFELVLIAAFLTGAYFSEAALLAGAYVVFLGVVFHGPSHWKANQAEFGFFVDHFTFLAGLLFAAAHGPGRILAIQRGWLRRS